MEHTTSDCSKDGIVFAASTAHETISFAIHNGSHINVWQFDQEGNLKLNTSIEYKINVEQFTIINLADGGFLLLTANCNENCYWIAGSGRKYYFKKVATNGKVIGSLENAGAEFNCYRHLSSLQIFQNKENEYCTAVYCRDYYGVGKTDIDLLVKCFTDKDFSAD